jgi:Mg-chelatase subunit ChlD
VVSPRTALCLLSLAACQPPHLESAGGTGGKGGGAPEATGGTRGADPDFHVTFADAGAEAAAPASTDQSCIGELHEGKLVPVDLLLLLDTSGSMEDNAGGKSKWRSVRDALETFLADPLSAGLGVGLMTFPVAGKLCQKDDECGGGKEFCGRKGACAPAANVANVEAACYAVSPKCIDGMPCTPFGLCSVSGLRCADVGQPCKGGPAGDTCMPRPRMCTDYREAGCAGELYRTPGVPIAELPAAAPALQRALAAVIPEGATPTTAAAQGALDHLRGRAASNGGHKQVLVLATDGMPSMCGTTNTVDSAAAVLAAGAPGLSTYVIGVFSAAQLDRARPALQQLATAGGTGAPFILMIGSDLTQRFTEAINQIRGAAAGCEFTIPMPKSGSIDYDKVNVRISSAGADQDLAYVGGADRCDPVRGGWYYDVDPRQGTPTRVLICETTCRKVKVTVGLSVGLRYGCKTIVIQ